MIFNEQCIFSICKQLVDFRFGKKLSGVSSERTFTICGMSDSLAPEIVQGKGHGFAVDWYNAPLYLFQSLFLTMF